MSHANAILTPKGRLRPVERRGDGFGFSWTLVIERKRTSDPCQHAHIAPATTCSWVGDLRHCDGVADSAMSR
jgi:hypothetical protein